MAKNILFTAYLLAPAAGLLVNAFVQVSVIRYIRRAGLLKSIYAGFFAGLCGLALLSVLYWKHAGSAFHRMAPSMAVNTAIYAAAGYCYFHFVGLGETARRIRMIAEIYDSENGLTLEEILQRYNAAQILEKRISRLLGNGQLECRDGKFFIGNPAVLLIARSVMLFKLLVLGKRSEFDKGRD